MALETDSISAAGAAAVTLSPYGTWASPISAESLAKGAIGVSDLRVADGRLFWLENRPDEGRLVLMTDDPQGCRPLTPPGFNVRSRVHEYGGAPFVVAGDTVYFSNFADQRLFAHGDAGPPLALTPEGYRYADCQALKDGGLIGVREDHTDARDVKNTLVRLSARPGDAGVALFGDSDFVAYPRISPDGRHVAWMAWDHPNMPWDDTRLYVAELTETGLDLVRRVAGGGAESVMEPQWGPDGRLYFISDRSGFWNLYVGEGDDAKPLMAKDADFAGPLWGLGRSTFAFIGGGLIAATYGDGHGDHLVLIDPASGRVREVKTPFSVIISVHPLNDGAVALIAASGEETAAVVTVDVETGAVTVIRRPSPRAISIEHVSRAEAVTFAGAGGRDVHALYYRPVNSDVRAGDDERPPVIVQVHGGPTGQASGAFSMAIQFWTTRGFAVVDVDYSGSSGYGRAYRQRLNGQWGVVDVEDVIAAVEHLARLGWVDANRVAIHGGSAGGFTVLAALAQSDVFKAGASFYGVADLEALARDTHKFESRYLDNLVGPYPAAKAVYEARSPINRLGGFSAPLIIFQGADDPVVPPNQAHMILNALRERRQPVAYMEFAGESHGFRRAESVIASKKAELYFYGEVFRLALADDLPVVPIENL